MKINNLIVSSIPFQIIIFNEIFRGKTCDTNAQVHQTFDLEEKHGGKCVYIRIPEQLFHIFLILFGTYMS